MVMLKKTAKKMSVCGVVLVRIFLHMDWIRRYTEYRLLFSPNAGNADQINSEYGHFSRSGMIMIRIISTNENNQINFTVHVCSIKFTLKNWCELKSNRTVLKFKRN